MAAAAIDMLVPALGALILVSAGLVTAAMVAVVVAWTLYYFFALESSGGQTVGKRLMRLRVAAADGAVPSLRQAAVRTLVRLADTPLLGLLAMRATGARRQRLGDIAAGTVVLDVGAVRPRLPNPPAPGFRKRPAVLARIVWGVWAGIASARRVAAEAAAPGTSRTDPATPTTSPAPGRPPVRRSPPARRITPQTGSGANRDVPAAGGKPPRSKPRRPVKRHPDHDLKPMSPPEQEEARPKRRPKHRPRVDPVLRPMAPPDAPALNPMTVEEELARQPEPSEQERPRKPDEERRAPKRMKARRERKPERPAPKASLEPAAHADPERPAPKVSPKPAVAAQPKPAVEAGPKQAVEPAPEPVGAQPPPDPPATEPPVEDGLHLFTPPVQRPPGPPRRADASRRNGKPRPVDTVAAIELVMGADAGAALREDELEQPSL